MKTPKRTPDIKNIIFDLGNVLLLYDAKKAARRFAEACGVPVYKVWLHFFTHPTEKAYTRGEIGSLAFYRHAEKALALPLNYRTFSYYWNDIFTENKGMDALLTKLGKKYPLYLISNTNKLHFEYIKKNFDILRHFKRKYASHEVGFRKPDKQIFQLVLDRNHLVAEETVFIDDDIKFVRGARKTGLHAIHFKGREQLVKDLRKLCVKI